jgi:hypothetical protein
VRIEDRVFQDARYAETSEAIANICPSVGSTDSVCFFLSHFFIALRMRARFRCDTVLSNVPNHKKAKMEMQAAKCIANCSLLQSRQ